MDAGQLNAFIIPLKKTATRDDTGGEVVTYVAQDGVSAKAKPLRGQEFAAMRQVESGVEVMFTIYFREDITADWRVRWRIQDYEIVGIPIDVEGKKEWLELQCRTAQG